MTIRPSFLPRLLTTALTAASLTPLRAQPSSPTSEAPKQAVYGEVGLGFGKTLFFSDIREKLRAAIGADEFTPNSGANALLAFYVAPARWRGLGLGVRAKVFGAGPSAGPSGEEYFFNYYHLGPSVKYYPLSRTFNRGFYLRASYGSGQLTTKRDDQDAARTYRHQFAVGGTLLGGLGYSLPVGRVSLSLELEAERSRRNGTISGLGDDQVLRSGQWGLNAVLTF